MKKMIIIGIASFLLLVFVGLPIGCCSMLGIEGFGPVVEHKSATINRLYVDSGEASHYMVGTDMGTFEVDNGLMLGLWNCDELYSSLKEGRTYNITTKGNRVVGWFFQQYPYVIRVEEVR